MHGTVEQALERFQQHYAERFGAAAVVPSSDRRADGSTRFEVQAEPLKDRNYPAILHREARTADVLVLIHGYTSSPYYVDAIARRFASLPVSVVVPLLSGHGMKDPTQALKAPRLEEQWKADVDVAVDVARLLGDRVSVGGFSAGGTLALNKALRDPELVGGGVFLFSSVLGLGARNEFLARLPLVPWLTRVTAGRIRGVGPNPYRYPTMPHCGGIGVARIIAENRQLTKQRPIPQPVFAAHSVHDTIGRIAYVIDLLSGGVKAGFGFVESEHVEHENLVLQEDLPLTTGNGPTNRRANAANPQFDEMMDSVISFFRQRVTGHPP